MSKNNLFSSEVMDFARSSFLYVEKDMFGGERLFFENSGGSLRLKNVVETDATYAGIPDHATRLHKASLALKEVFEKGIIDLKLFFNAQQGTVAAFHTASQAMFEIVRVVSQNAGDGNIVTTQLEHPSAYDACQMYGTEKGKEVRIAEPNKLTGCVDAEAITRLVDRETFLLNVILTSNITGGINDIEQIVKQARAINPDIFVVVDGVQYAAHGVIDVAKWDIDAMTIAPYKMFGNRGVGFVYLSDRLAQLPHHKLAGDGDDWILGSVTPSIYAGFSEIVDYIAKIGSFYHTSTDRRTLVEEGIKRIYLHEKELMSRLVHGSDDTLGLKDIQGVTVYFMVQDIGQRDPVIPMSFDCLSTDEAVLMYEQENIIVSDRPLESVFARRVLESLQMESVVRVSPLHCHTLKDVDQFLRVTKKIAGA